MSDPQSADGTPVWQPYREPVQSTLLRTGGIALVVGAVLARWMGGLTAWPLATALVLWPSLGGHFVELGFLNGLRPRLPAARAWQVAARLAVWFASGALLSLGMALTALALRPSSPAASLGWRWGGLAFIGIELIAHLVLQLRGRPSFYNGRG